MPRNFEVRNEGSRELQNPHEITYQNPEEIIYLQKPDEQYQTYMEVGSSH